MKYQSHLIIAGAAITLTQPWHQGIVEAFIIYGLGLLGGLLPDIDHPGSFIGSRVPVLPTILFRNGGHRGVTHSLLGLAVVSIAGFVIAAAIGHQSNIAICWAFGLGYASHLAADIITNRGIPVCWPVSTRFVIPITTTGSPLELMIVIGIFLITAFLTLRSVFSETAFGMVTYNIKSIFTKIFI